MLSLSRKYPIHSDIIMSTCHTTSGGGGGSGGVRLKKRFRLNRGVRSNKAVGMIDGGGGGVRLNYAVGKIRVWCRFSLGSNGLDFLFVVFFKSFGGVVKKNKA